MRNNHRHSLSLVLILLVGALLRFYNLDLKPPWLDEILTALWSLGLSFDAIPRNQVFSLSDLGRILALNPTTCSQITHNIATQDTHVPLFFCGLHTWLKAIAPLHLSLSWSLRAFPALLGVIQIAVIYVINRVAFSPAAGLMGAALMAVSPYHVSLSQEARQYTAATLCVSLALLGLIRIGSSLQHKRIQSWVWLGWVLVNSLGFYIHYFFFLAVVAQGITLLTWMFWQRFCLARRHWLTAGFALTVIFLSYLPWLPILLKHTKYAETGWIQTFRTSWLSYLSPIYQSLAGWVIMVIALPLENQPWWVAVPMALLMLTFFVWLVRQVYGRLVCLKREPETRTATQMLLGFTGCVLLQFLAIIYILGKNLFLAPRYNFVYYPAVSALLGASLIKLPHPQGWLTHFPQRIQLRQWGALLAGGISCICVITNLALTKPFSADQFAQEVQTFSMSQTVLMAYESTTDIALGLSLGLATLNQKSLHSNQIDWGFFPRSSQAASGTLEQALPQIRQPLTKTFSIWLVGLKWQQTSFPSKFGVSSQAKDQFICQTKPEDFSEVVVPHQRYVCFR